MSDNNDNKDTIEELEAEVHQKISSIADDFTSIMDVIAEQEELLSRSIVFDDVDTMEAASELIVDEDGNAVHEEIQRTLDNQERQIEQLQQQLDGATTKRNGPPVQRRRKASDFTSGDGDERELSLGERLKGAVRNVGDAVGGSK